MFRYVIIVIKMLNKTPEETQKELKDLLCFLEKQEKYNCYETYPISSLINMIKSCLYKDDR